VKSWLQPKKNLPHLHSSFLLNESGHFLYDMDDGVIAIEGHLKKFVKIAWKCNLKRFMVFKILRITIIYFLH